MLVGAIFPFRARDLQARHDDLEAVVISGVAEAAHEKIVAATPRSAPTKPRREVS